MNRQIGFAAKRGKVVGCAALVGLSTVPFGCAAGPPADPEVIASKPSALLGGLVFDSSCSTAPNPQTVPPANPAFVMRHLQIGDAYARITANSPAFRECIASVMARPTLTGVPPNQGAMGPYYACDGDPTPGTADKVMESVLSCDQTLIGCDYSTIGGTTGGYTIVGNIDAAGREVITIGNALEALYSDVNCNYNPDAAGSCVDDGIYAFIASVVAHEVMHAHGYSHVNDNVANSTDIYPGASYSLADFCGITPTPDLHPTYGSSIPYEVQTCVNTVLGWSAATGHMHDDCGAGLKLVDSVLSGSPDSATSHCVSDPECSSIPPIPPRPPTCTLTRDCDAGPLLLSCSGDHPNPIHLERRPAGSSSDWQSGTFAYDASYEYRACAESIYGRACSVPTVLERACPVMPRPIPWPWWQWLPFTGTVASKSTLAARIGGGAIMVLPVPAAVAGQYSELGGASGDLSAQFGALGVGVYDAPEGAWIAMGPSTGKLPPMRGTAFAVALGVDGAPHLLAFGGESDNGLPLSTLYEGAMKLTATLTSTNWTSSSMAGGPGARTHAAAVATVTGDGAYVFGGRALQGVLNDLWSYQVATGQWAKLAIAPASLPSPRVDASIAVDEQHLVVFGGRDAKGNPLSDLFVLDLATGKAQTYATTAAPRANAAVAIQAGKVLIYGGTASAGPNDALDVVALVGGKTLSTRHLGVAASSGSSIGLDAAGLLTVVPGSVPNAGLAGGAFVGTVDQLTLIKE